MRSMTESTPSGWIIIPVAALDSRMKQRIRSVAPIRTDADHEAVLVEIERMWGAPVGTPEGDRLDLLMVLADAYERARWPDLDQDPIEAIKARMENSGRTRKDFANIVGSSGRASEILNRRRHLTLPMIWRLVNEWKMPAEVLVRPYPLAVRDQPTSRKTRIARAAS